MDDYEVNADNISAQQEENQPVPTLYFLASTRVLDALTRDYREEADPAKSVDFLLKPMDLAIDAEACFYTDASLQTVTLYLPGEDDRELGSIYLDLDTYRTRLSLAEAADPSIGSLLELLLHACRSISAYAVDHELVPEGEITKVLLGLCEDGSIGHRI